MSARLGLPCSALWTAVENDDDLSTDFTIRCFLIRNNPFKFSYTRCVARNYGA
jgi:hypothetical protein